MAFKPNRREEGDLDLDKLLTILNQTKTSVENNPLYQFCKSLLNTLNRYLNDLNKRLKTLEDADDSTSDTPTTDALDYVVLSDGALPTPSPVNDGFGNFIYIPYEP